ncbi:MAG: TlpA disulfide reductase family protein [Chloroflexota bacterium]|nr:TlpA family protein disulfide reductase [Dehalococcoidia bacterium]MDW8254642.1 TlpA disulfide reductase family protein [Chloroflexota bacterium]
MAKSKTRSAARSQAPAAALSSVAPAPNTPKVSSAKSAPRRPRTARRPVGRRLDWRWIAVGAVALLFAAIITANIVGNRGSGSTTVGEITGPSIGPLQRAASPLPIGTPAPNLTWTINGQAGSLEALRGQPVLLEFFATWCPHCQSETAVLRSLQNRYGDRVHILAVSASPNGMDQRSPSSIADIERFQSRFNTNYPHYFDRDLIGARLYGVTSFPTLYLIDRNGVIRYVAEGAAPESILAAEIDKVLTS